MRAGGTVQIGPNGQFGGQLLNPMGGTTAAGEQVKGSGPAEAAQAPKLSPQEHVDVAFGLLMRKPRRSRPCS